MKLKGFYQFFFILLFLLVEINIAQDFKISPNTDLPEGSCLNNVSIASDPDAGFLVTWINTYTAGSIKYWHNYACRVSKTGEMLDSAAIFLGSSYWPYYCPSAIFDGDNWIILFNQGGMIESVGAVRLTPDGEVLDDPPVTICNSVGLATIYYPVIGNNGNESICVTGVGGEGLYGSIFDRNLNIIADNFLILKQALVYSKPRIVSVGNNFFMTFVNADETGAQYAHNVKLVIINPQGEILSIQSVNELSFDNRGNWGVPSICVLNDIIYITYFDTPNLYARRYSPDGQPIDSVPVKVAESAEFDKILNQFYQITGHHYTDLIWTKDRFSYLWPLASSPGIKMFNFASELSPFINESYYLNSESQIGIDLPEDSYSLIRSSSIGNNILAAWIDIREDNGRVYGNYFNIDEITGVRQKENTNGKPEKFLISQNYPNPFNSSTQIDFSIPEEGFAEIVVYNSLGQEIAKIVNQNLEAAYYTIKFCDENLPSGVYYYRLISGEYSETRKMVLIK